MLITISRIRTTCTGVMVVGATLLPQLLLAQDYVYPVTRQDATFEMHHGVAVAHPFRWLEQQDAPEVDAWVRA